MNTAQRLEKLREKALQKETQLADCGNKINSAKAEIKALKKEISAIKREITALELMQLSETLSTNGLTAADVEAAIADGSLKKAEKADENCATYSTKFDQEKENAERERATYSTNPEIKAAEEDAKNEISDS